MNFHPSDIFDFRSFDCPLGSHPESLQQKCDPYKYAQNSFKSRLCVFAHQTFSIFVPLAVPWGPILDPCGKSAVLTGARKIQIKIVYAFLPIRHFPFSLLWLSLGIPSWILAAKV
jgi:hypothetical protein